MVVDDDEALTIVGTGFGSSEPGAELHQLVLVREGKTALGLPTPQIEIYAIVPTYDNALDAHQFIARTIRAAVAREPSPPVLATIRLEVSGVVQEDLTDEAAENRARVLHANGRLRDHAQAIEVTQLYAAAADGRRWDGEHWLTGPRAGEKRGPVRHAPGTRSNADAWPFADLIRAAVGLRW